MRGFGILHHLLNQRKRRNKYWERLNLKNANEIIKWGCIKPYFDTSYDFNTLDLETIDNDLFAIGVIENNVYKWYEDDFYNILNDFLISSVQNKKDILTWSKYDNTHIIKLLFKDVDDTTRKKLFLKIGKITPIYTYDYKNFTITIVNIIKYSVIFKIDDNQGNKPKNVIIYNLMNLFTTNLETTAKNYKINFYSKLGEQYHIIDKDKFYKDKKYNKMVIRANELDNLVLIHIAEKFLKNFYDISGGIMPKTIYTAGSIARSYLLSYKDDFGGGGNLAFNNIFKVLDEDMFNVLLDFSMQSYHGGKVEAYAIGYIREGFIIDKNSAYPHALSKLPQLTDKVHFIKGNRGLNKYFYAFIKCHIHIEDIKFIHSIIVKAVTNDINVSPYGYINDVIITKPEYDFLIENGISVHVVEYVAIEHLNIYPYEKMVNVLIQGRYTTKNDSLADLYKTIINSLYGITFELTPIYEEVDEEIIFKGYRAGDYFNPIIASYITAMTRIDLSMIDNHIIQNGGEVYMNMTDSITYNGDVNLDIFSKTKILGKYSMPEPIKNIYIMGTGRYEYQLDDKTYVVKNRGFIPKKTDKGFYSTIELSEEVIIKIKSFVTIFKSTTNSYSYEKLGYLLEDDYKIQPFNLGGKRFVINKKINLNKEYSFTRPLYLDKYY